MTGWYSRPVLFVRSIEDAIAFYRDKLGFTETNRYEADGRALVGEVMREDCILLFDCQQPERIGTGRMFISLDLPELQALREELIARGADIEDGWWGYALMVARDPDGNELLFPYPAGVTPPASPAIPPAT